MKQTRPPRECASRSALRALRRASAPCCALPRWSPPARPRAATRAGPPAVAASEAQAGHGLAFSRPAQRRRHLVRARPLRQHTACGQILRPHTIGVAHRILPCGTTVKFVYHGQPVVTQVIDRGPYAKGVAWDLTNGASEALGFEGVGPGPLRDRPASGAALAHRAGARRDPGRQAVLCRRSG